MFKSIVRVVVAVLISAVAIAAASSTRVQASVKTMLQKSEAGASASVFTGDAVFGKSAGRDRYYFQSGFGAGEGHECGSDPTSDY